MSDLNEIKYKSVTGILNLIKEGNAKNLCLETRIKELSEDKELMNVEVTLNFEYTAPVSKNESDLKIQYEDYVKRG